MKSKYFKLLSDKFKTNEDIVTEIINLEAILNLPKGTEHFLSDLHGEYDAFSHVLRNGSGNVKQKINGVTQGKLSKKEVQNIATLIYYPEEMTEKEIKKADDEMALAKWYKETLWLLVDITVFSSSKYTRSKLRKALPENFCYIMEELIYRTDEKHDKKAYYKMIIESLTNLGEMRNLIIAFCYVIQRLVVDHLHIVGDIYDRGPHPDKIIDELSSYRSVDIQWGNHDLLWMGAVCGSQICIANLIRISARYNNLDIIEDAYGINMRPLLRLAEKYYDDNKIFAPKISKDKEGIFKEEVLQNTKIHQAISVIQFKLEAEIIDRRPEFQMKNRSMLEKIDYDKNTITIEESEYELSNTCFKTIDPKNPNKLLDEEREVISKLMEAFMQSKKLLEHMDFLFKNGSLYLPYNGNLLFHGCIPMESDASFEAMQIDGELYSGKELFDIFEYHMRKSYAFPHINDDLSTDLMWYLWCGKKSVLFGKKAMKTFERYFISDKNTHKEELNPYYELREDEEISGAILEEFGLDRETGHIINGHTPVKEIKGENPVKAGGKLIVIDGGFSKPYHDTTGIAGYTLLYNSYGIQLACHQAFISKWDAIINGTDIVSSRRLVERKLKRKKVLETTIGRELLAESEALKSLLQMRREKSRFLF